MSGADDAQRERHSRRLTFPPRRPAGAACPFRFALFVRFARLGGAAACLLAAVVLFSPATATETAVKPAVQSAEVSGATLTLTFSGKSWNYARPAPSRFSVAGTDNGPTEVTAVAISEDRFKVLLSLSPAVQNGDTGVTVSYTQGDDKNPLQNGAGKAPDFANQQVTNSTPAGADTTAPTVASATVNGSVLTLTFNEAMDRTKVPLLPERFSVAGTDSTTTAVDAYFPTGQSTELRVRVKPAVTAGDTGITVSYARGTEQWAVPLRDSAGNTLLNFSGQQVTNNTGVTNTPADRTVIGAWVDGTTLTLQFSKNLKVLGANDPPPDASRFTVAGTTPATTVTGVTVLSFATTEHPYVKLSLSPGVPRGATGITVSYASGNDANPLKYPSGSKVPDFSGQAVVNSAGTPRQELAMVDGSTLQLIFSKIINARNGLPDKSRFTVAGTASPTAVTGVRLRNSLSVESVRVELTLNPAVSKGDTGITVSYAQGTDDKPLKDTAGSKVADFSGQAVLNTTGVPTVQSATVNGSKLTLTFTEPLYTSKGPPFFFAGTMDPVSFDHKVRPVILNGVFLVNRGASVFRITRAVFKGTDPTSTMELTLSPAVTSDDTGISVHYTRGAEPRPLRDWDGNYAPDFSGQEVTNNSPGPAAMPTVAAVAGLGDRLSVRWREPVGVSGITDYDVRWYQGSDDPVNEADWVEAGEAGGHDHSGKGRNATITGLDANTAYRVQVRAVTASGSEGWSESGSAVTAAWAGTSAPTSGALVSNTGQTTDSGFNLGLDNDVAQAFDTGSEAFGYKLTSVKVSIVGNSGTATHTAQVFVADNNSGHPTGSSLGTLTNPASLATSGTKTWTATGGGIDLEPDEGYVFVLDVTGLTGTAPSVSRAASWDEDAGAAPGWSIADSTFYRSHTVSTAGWGTEIQRRIAKIEIHGYTKGVPDAPAVRAAQGIGDRLTVRWRKPGGTDAITDYDVRWYKGAADPEDEADWIEPDDTGGHDHTGTGTKATITGLDADTAYRVQIRAVNATGNGPWSASGGATTASGAVTGAGTSGTLVSNTGQTSLSTTAVLSKPWAQGFTTGGNARGYTLTGVDVYFKDASGDGTYTAGIWSANASGEPHTRLGTLTFPASPSVGLETLEASGGGIDLEANTTYFISFGRAGVGTSHPNIGLTPSDAEDLGRAAGWRIANGSFNRKDVTSPWFEVGPSLTIAIKGYAKKTGGRASSRGALVSNTGQTAAGSYGLDADLAQAFDTGSHAAGYRLTSVKVAVIGGAGTATHTAHVFVADNNSGHPTGSSLGTLTNPASLATTGIKTWTATGAGIDLDPDEGYVFVLDMTEQTGDSPAARKVATWDEDARRAPGWSIANTTFFRNLSSSGGWSRDVTGRVMQIEIHGYAKPPPAAPEVSAVALQPDRLAVEWSAPAGVAATDYDLRWYQGSIDPADEADWIEAGEPGGVDHTGTVTTATITGLLPLTTYRVQVRATSAAGAGPWSASGSGRTEGHVGASGTVVRELMGNLSLGTVHGTTSLASHDTAQGFTTDGYALGYTVTSVVLPFETVPDAGVRVRLATGVSTSAAGTVVATLRNPAAFRTGHNSFTAPAGTTLEPDTEYFVVVEGPTGSLARTNYPHWSAPFFWKLVGAGLNRTASETGAWTRAGNRLMFRVNGRRDIGDPPGKPEAPTAAPLPGTNDVVVSWFAPDYTGSGITDYDLRYYEGASDPAEEADWVEEIETSGLGLKAAFESVDDASTGWKIRGLRANTAYWVQVRAESYDAPGPWSESAAVTTAAAPTRAALVSNTGQAAQTANDLALTADYAQPFVTGGYSGGYKLTAVRAAVGLGFAPPYTAQIFLADFTTGKPTGSSLGTLTNPGSDSMHDEGHNTWTATGGGIDLEPNKGYVFVLDVARVVTPGPEVKTTHSDAEDAGTAPGWNIHSFRFGRAFDGTSWSKQSDVLQMEIHGYRKAGAKGAPAGGGLVSNTGQTTASAANLAPMTGDQAQPFDTGGHTLGYKLTAVKAAILAGSQVPTYTAQIYLADTTTGQPTGSSLGTLTNPASLASDGVKTWTATGGGIDLEPNKGYVFVLDVTAIPGVFGLPTIETTASHAEDAGKASGWSIATFRFHRTFNTGNWSSSTNVLKIQVHGYGKLPPSAPTRAKLGPTPADGCVADSGNRSFGQLTLAANVLISQSRIVDTSECYDEDSSVRRSPLFIDPNGDELTVTAVVGKVPDNVRFIDGTPFLSGDGNRVFLRAVAAGSDTAVGVNLKATDPDGQSASGYFEVIVKTLPDRSAPRFDEMVGTRGFPLGVPMPRWVLPPAIGGETATENTTGQLPYFYNVTGLPPGLSFDPLTRSVTGTPTTAGAYTVTYTADDADAAYSLKETPTAADLADAASQSFLVRIGAAAIELVQVASAPTYDSDGDGRFDTYIEGDTILVDVQFTEPVRVIGTPAEAGARPRVWLDLGDDSGLRADNRAVAELLEAGGELYGGRRLRFGYTVKGGNGEACTSATTTADCDLDGLWVQTKGTDGTVVLLPAGLAIGGLESGAVVRPTFEGLPTSGLAGARVDGSVTSAAIGPRPLSAETDADGDTITVTFSRALSPQADLNGLPLAAYFSVRGAGPIGAGQRGVYQHPNTVAVNGATLELELNTAARASDTVTLSYENIGTGAWPLKDTAAAPKRLAGFRDLAVTNNSTGVAAPVPIVASAVGKALEVVFDQRLDQDARPSGSAFTVEGSNLEGVRRTIAGAGGAVVVDDATVAVTLTAAVAADDVLSVSYDAPAVSPLAAAAGSPAVASFEAFYLEAVHDSTAPKLLSAVGTVFVRRSADATGQGKSKISVYFDEALDRASVPAAGDFALSSDHAQAVAGAAVEAVAIEGAAVVLTTSHWLGVDVLYKLAYTPGTAPLKDRAGNVVAKFLKGFTSIAVSQPVLRAATVAGTKMVLYMRHPLDPAHVPPASAFRLWEKDLVGSETSLQEYTGYRVVSVALDNYSVVLRLSNPVFPCAAEKKFRVSYTAPSTGGLQTTAGSAAASWAADKWKGQTDDYSLVTNTRHGRCAEWLAGTYVGSVVLRAQRPFARDRGEPEPAWFTVTASGGPVRVTGAAFTGNGRKELKLSLSREFGADEAVTVSYRRPEGAPGLWDASGNQLRDVANAVVQAGAPAAPAASFHGLPEAHDGSGLFGFEVRFSEEIAGLKLTAVESALTVTGGGLVDVKRTVRGKNDSVTVRVRPTSEAEVTVTLAATTDCAAAGAICASGRRALAEAVTATVPGPADTTPPAPVSAAAGGRLVTVTFDEDLAEPATTDLFNFQWTVDGTGSRHHPDRAWFADRRTVLLELAASFPAAAGQTVTVSYAASDFLRDAAGNRVADFTMTAAAVAGAAATGAPAVTGTAQVGETLTAETGGIADADGLTGAVFAFQWVSSRDGADTDIAGATASSYTLAAADAGAAIKVRVSFTDDGGNAETLVSAATAAVTAADTTPPAPVRATAVGHLVTVTFDEDLAEPASTEWFNFEWTVDGTGSRHHPERAWFADRRTVSLELAASFPAVARQTVTVSYTASDFLRDAAGNRVADFSMAAPLANAPATGVPAIAGTEQEGETLVASTHAIADTNGLSGAVFAFQWVSSRDGVDTDIAGATAATYTLAAADVGARIKVRVSFTDDSGFSEALTSAPTYMVVPLPRLTAAFHGVPARHDGSEAFSFEVRFSEEFQGLQPGVFLAGGLRVDNGVVVAEAAERNAAGGYGKVSVLVQPTSWRDVTLTLPATTDCAAAGAICAVDGRKLSNTSTATVQGPPPLTAALHGVPAKHDGSEPFWFKVRFSKEFRGLRLEAFAAGALQVENGQLVEVAQTVPGENRSVTVWVMPTSWRDVTLTLPATTDCAAAEAICMVDGRKLVNTSTATVKRPTPLTAALHRVPEAHDGSEAFDFEVRFNQEFRGLRLEAFAAGALQVENGRVVDAKQAVEGENRSINVRVRPDGYQDVTLTLARPTDCGAAGAICPMDGHKLSNTSTATVRGPITISVADAEADEAAGATIEFTVTLSRAAPGPVTVDYATSDGTATAGEDYTAASGTLTFAAGVLAQTVAVALLDDAIDEGRETFTLTLSNPSGAVIADGEAVGTIINTDQMPKAWNARFGRAVAVHVVEAVEARLEGQGDSFVQVGGHRLGGAAPDVLDSVQGLAPGQDPGSSPRQVLFAAGEAGEAAGEGAGNGSGDLAGQHVTFRDLLLGSAFHLVSEPGERPGAPRLSAWGRVATSGFDAVEDKLSLNGTVTTATLGVDGVWKRWLTGLLLAYSEGDGSFSHAELPGGEVASTLTSLHPYAAYRLTDRVRLWGTVGYGSGALRLTLENGPGTEEAERRVLATDLAMTMGALGARGELLRGARGLELALRSDVLWMAMDSAAAPDLGATTAEVSRLRLVLEGSRPVSLGGGGMVTPTLQIGLRHDGGDAETGTGVEVGAGLRYATAWGLSVEASARTLVAHEAEDYREWGASGALRYDPGRQGLGLTASLAPTWGTAGSGVEHLWGLPGGAGLGVPGGGVAPAGRLDAELGYGLAALRGRGLLTPYARVALTEGADQAWHLGARLAVAESLNLSLEASRRAAAGAAAAHDLALLATLGF